MEGKERYQECYNVYKDMIKNISDDQEVERMTNLTAVTANIADKAVMVGEQQVASGVTREYQWIPGSTRVRGAPGGAKAHQGAPGATRP